MSSVDDAKVIPAAKSGANAGTSDSSSQSTSATEPLLRRCSLSKDGEHKHGPGCGHVPIVHGDHVGYLHNGFLHCKVETSNECITPRHCIMQHKLSDSSIIGRSCSDGPSTAQTLNRTVCGTHSHGPSCGHERIAHGDHFDYLVGNELHHPHDNHCDIHGSVATKPLDWTGWYESDAPLSQQISRRNNMPPSPEVATKPWYKDRDQMRFCCMFTLTGGFMLVELVVGIMSGSLSLLTDAMHMVSDLLALIFGFYALRVARRRNTETATYGYTRMEVVGGLINGVFLLAVCFSLALDAIKRFFYSDNDTLEDNAVEVLWVGALGLLVNILGMVIFGHHHDHDHGHGHGHSHGHEHEHEHEHNDEHGAHSHTHSKKKKRRCPHNAAQSLAHKHVAQALAAAAMPANPQASPSASSTLPLSPAPQSSSSNSQNSQNSQSQFPLLPGQKTMPLDLLQPPTTSPSAAHDSTLPQTAAGTQAPPHGLAMSVTHTTAIDVVVSDQESADEASDTDSEDQSVERKSLRATKIQPLVPLVRTPAASLTEGQKKKTARNMNIQGVFLHILGDALGSIAVIVSAAIIAYTKWSNRIYADPVCSLVITMLITCSTFPLVRASTRVLLQQVPSHLQPADLKRELCNVQGVLEIHDFHIWALNLSKLVGSLHVTLYEGSDFMTISDKLKMIMHHHGVHSTTIQPEYVSRVPSVSPAGVADTCHEPFCDDVKCASYQCCQSPRV